MFGKNAFKLVKRVAVNDVWENLLMMCTYKCNLVTAMSQKHEEVIYNN